MKPVKKFPKIGHFKDLVKTVKHHSQIVDKDEDNNPIMDRSIELPTLTFEGTVKLHGTNGGVCWMKDDNGFFKGFWTQTRKNVITPNEDNNGFSNFIYHEIDPDVLFVDVKACVDKEYNENDYKGFIVYGEWCGKGINKGTGINEVDPRVFMVFDIVVIVDDETNYWVKDNNLEEIEFRNDRVHNIHHFYKPRVEIDFNNAKDDAEKINEIIEKVEKQCPVADKFGIEGIGEGLVFKPIDKDWNSSRFWFKAKGEQHKDTHTKQKTPVDHERMESINKMVDSLVTDHRLEKGIEHLKEEGLDIDRKNLGEFLKWVNKDIMEEESDNIKANGFEPKELNKQISKKAREWFFEKEEENIYN